jgi:rubrerythrin
MSTSENENISENIDRLLLEAMEREIKAKQFYLDASSKAISTAAKKLFEELAEFEQHHYDKLKQIIESRKHGQQIMDATTGNTLKSVKPEVEGEIEANKNEIVNVLHLAIEAEKQAQDRYIKIANLFLDDTGKQVFHRLAEEERNHQRILEDQILSSLK